MLMTGNTDSTCCMLQLWDVGGQQQADLLDSQFYGSAAGAVIVCKLEYAECVARLQHWQQKLHQVIHRCTQSIQHAACLVLVSPLRFGYLCYEGYHSGDAGDTIESL